MMPSGNPTPHVPKSGKTFFVILLVVFFTCVGFLFGYATPHRVSPNALPSIIRDIVTTSSTSKIDQNVFESVWDRVTNEYLHRGDVTSSELYYGVLKGLVASLGDPYSIFLTPDESEQFSSELSGKFQGIGAEITIREDLLTIVSPLSGSPAEKAGLLPNDTITHIDQNSTSSMELDEAVSRIRGEEGTTVVLTIVRAGRDEAFDVTIKREAIQVKSVEVTFENEIAIVTLTSFNEDTEPELALAVQEIALQSPRGIILDLRNNPGGLLDVSVEIASTFLPKESVVVIERDAQGGKITHSTEKEGKLLDIPLIVLVNQGSASAAEIVAGALKDHNRAKLLGSKTFGKGTVQSFEPLSDGSSLKLTVAEWLTPNGTSFDGSGIDPDVVVEMTEEDYTQGRDPQLSRAKEELLR